MVGGGRGIFSRCGRGPGGGVEGGVGGFWGLGGWGGGGICSVRLRDGRASRCACMRERERVGGGRGVELGGRRVEQSGRLGVRERRRNAVRIEITMAVHTSLKKERTKPRVAPRRRPPSPGADPNDGRRR